MTIVNGLGNRTLLTHTMRALKQYMRGMSGGLAATAFTNGSFPTTPGGSHGVAGNDDFKVTAQGSPNMTVAVAAGFALILQDANAHAGSGSIYNDASVNVTVTAAHATLLRTDLICLQMRDNVEDALTFNDWRVFCHPGTAGAGVPAPPLGCLVIAQIGVTAAATAITNAMITNTRPYLCALGGTQRVLSTARPTAGAIWPGKKITELDTGREFKRNIAGTAWLPTSGRVGVDLVTSADATIGAGALLAIPFDTEVYDSDAYHVASATICTIPAGLGGVYGMTAMVLSSVPMSGFTAVAFDINGTDGQEGGIQASRQRGGCARQISLAAGDTVRLLVNSGHNATASYHCAMNLTYLSD